MFSTLLLAMSIATITAVPHADDAARNSFSFEHAMAHRALLQVMGPLDQWTVLPYFIDPADFQANGAVNWNLNHRQAHDDFINYLPAHSTSLTPGFPNNQNLLDPNLADRRTWPWWTFINHQEHYNANAAIFPLQLSGNPIPPATEFVPPWWLQAPRYAPGAW
jgi:hypothetical protein